MPWFLFYASLVITGYVWFVQQFTLSGAEITRTLSANQITQGEQLRILVSYRLRKPSPLSWLIIRHYGEAAAFLEEDRQVDFPGWKRQGRGEVVTYRLPRGRHRFDGVEVSSGDLFGFVEKKRILDKREEVLVFPRIHPIRFWSAIHERKAGRSLSTPRISEDVTAVVGVRDYTNRDRLSRIHWKASARGQGLKVKEFEQQVTHDLLFVLDCCMEEGSPDPDQSVRFERAVSLTASLIHHAMERRLIAGLLTNGHTPCSLPMGRGQEHLLRLLRHLAEVRADGSFPLDEVVAQQVSRLSRGAKVVLISTRLGEDARKAVAHLSHFRMQVEYCWINTEEPPTTAETACYTQLRQWGVHCVPVPHDGFNEIFRGGGSHGGKHMANQ